MKSKILGSFFLSIFLVAMFGVFVSAATVFSDDFNDGDLSGWTVNGWNNTATNAESTQVVNSVLQRTISTSGFQTIVVKYDRQLGANWESTDLFKVSWSTDGTNFNTLEEVMGNSNDSLPDDSSFVSQIFNLPSSADNNANFEIKFECTTNAQSEFCRVDNVVVEGTAAPPTLTEPQEVTACSAIGNPGELKVKDIDFNNLGSLIFKEVGGNIYFELGDDDEWFPLDDLEIDIEIENNGKEDVDDIEVEWGLYNTKRNEMVIDFDEEDEVNIKDGKDEIITAEFNLEDELDVDLDDLDDGKNYRFYVLATGDVDDGASTTTRTCVSDFENVEIIIENDFVVLNDVRFPEIVQCGENVQISGKVWNIGEDDQDEVKVEVHNNVLGLFHKTTEIGDIDAFDDDAYNFNFKVPNDAEEKFYSLVFSVLDEDFDVYENDFDDDDSKFTLPIKVSGGCSEEAAAVSISVNLESGGKAGEELVVRVVVTNTGDDSADYLVNAAGFSLWASSANVNPTAFTLNSGQSRDVLITLNVRDDSSGDEVFDLEVLSGNELVARQPVSVLIEGRGGFLTGGVIGAFGGGSTYLWLLGLLNIILVIVIIVVAVRALRK